MVTSTKLISVLVILSIMMEVTSPLCTPPGVLAVTKQVNSLCTPPDTSWRSYVPTPAPMEFKGTPTACAKNVCLGPHSRQIRMAARLADGVYGTDTLNVTATHAWNTNVTIVFTLDNSNVKVKQINLYFYNIPSRNIGLPYDTILLSESFFIEGNQDLSQSDNQLRNVTLIPTPELTGMQFTIQFNFSNIDKIDWLLLTEVEICTEGTNLLQLMPISFLANRITHTCTNSTISLLCTVENEGRFTWSWTLPSGDSRPPTFILDTGRTSVLELSQISSIDNGDYQCHVNYSGLANFQKIPEATTIITLVTEDCTTSLANSTPASDTTSTLISDTNSTHTGSTSTDDLPNGIHPAVGIVCAVLLICIIVAATLTVIIVYVKKHKKGSKPDGVYDSVKEAPSTRPVIRTQDDNTLDNSTGQTVVNKSYETNNLPKFSGVETEEYDSQLYSCVQVNQEVTINDTEDVVNKPLYVNAEMSDGQDDECYPEHVYSAVQKKKKEVQVSEKNVKSTKEDNHNDDTSHPLYSVVQKKKKGDNKEADDIECYPEHVYSAVQKKKKKKTSQEEAPHSDMPDELKDMYAVVQKKPKN